MTRLPILPRGRAASARQDLVKHRRRVVDWLGAGVLVVVALGATVQFITGTGFALVCAPFLLLLLGHDVGVRAVLVLSLALNACLLVLTVRHVRWKDSVLLLLPAVALAIPAASIVDAIRGPALNALAGVVIVAATLLVVRGRTFKVVDTPGGVLIVGAVSGVTTIVAGVSGPPVTLLAIQREWESNVARATMQAFFLPLNLLALLMLGPFEADTSHAWWAVGGCILGILAGVIGVRRVPAPAVRWGMLTVAALGGAWLIITGGWELLVPLAHGERVEMLGRWVF